MKKNLLLTLFFLTLIGSFSLKAEIIITGIVDGTLSGGLPKAIELYVHGTEDFSDFSMQRSSNGGAFSNIGSLSGTYTNEFVYLTNNSTEFVNTFGNAGDRANLIVLSGVNGNGNDAFALLDINGMIVDQVWEANSANYYQDSYAYRNNGTGPDGGWVIGNWTAAGNNALDGMSVEDIGVTVPLGTYLPVNLSAELVGPSVEVASNHVTLHWTTLSETNSGSFTVEKSTDGISFRSMATLEAAGNSSTQIDYNWVDQLPRFGLNYYRLKISDANGNVAYSSIVVVKFETKFPTFVITPNISAQTISLKLSKETDSSSDIGLFDMGGRKLLQKNLPAYQFIETLDVSDLAPGIYVISVRIGSDVYAERFMKF